jgi:hypothetical protein
MLFVLIDDVRLPSSGTFVDFCFWTDPVAPTAGPAGLLTEIDLPGL